MCFQSGWFSILLLFFVFANFGECDVLWYSRFESEKGVPVTDGEPADTIDNVSGEFGWTIGNSEIQYIEHANSRPSSLENVGGSFAVLFPDDRSVSIDSGLPSDFIYEFTFEGFFNSFDVEPITDATFVGRRLVTQKLTHTGTSTRASIGLHSSADQKGNVLAVSWNDGTSRLGLGNTLLQHNQWYHFAAVYDGLNMTWYLDGEMEGIVRDVNLADPGTSPIAIGSHRTGGNGWRGFHGMLDEVRISDKALDSSAFLSNLVLMGDFNSSRTFDVADIDRLTQAIADRSTDPQFDLNENGIVDGDDLDVWIRDLAQTWYGDSNLDGLFDSSDMVQVFAAGKYDNDKIARWSEGDWSGDGRFNSGDLVSAFAGGGYDAGPRTVAPVPEPSTSALLVALCFFARHLRKQ